MAEFIVPGSDEAICPNCCEGNPPVADFCRECGAPLTVHATTDPMGQIYSMGFAYWQGTHCARSRIVLIGMWLLLLPEFILLETLAAIAFVGVLNEGLRPWWPLWKHLRQAVETCVLLSLISVAHSLCTVFYGTFLYKTTRSYRFEREFAQNDEPSIETDDSDQELSGCETATSDPGSVTEVLDKDSRCDGVFGQDDPRTVLAGLWFAFVPAFLISGCGFLTIVAVAFLDVAIRSEPIGYTLKEVSDYFFRFTIGCAITGGLTGYVGRFLYNKTNSYFAGRATRPAATPL